MNYEEKMKSSKLAMMLFIIASIAFGIVSFMSTTSEYFPIFVALSVVNIVNASIQFVLLKKMKKEQL